MCLLAAMDSDIVRNTRKHTHQVVWGVLYQELDEHQQAQLQKRKFQKGDKNVTLQSHIGIILSMTQLLTLNLPKTHLKG